MTDWVPGDGSAADRLSLADWRRRVSTLYAEVRSMAATDPATALAHWRAVRERLFRELERNVALKVEETDEPDTFAVSGRGELHLSILMETMRREGYEFQVSRPRVITRRGPSGELEEPYEEVVIEVPVTVTAEGGGQAAEAKPAKKGRKAKAEVEETVEEPAAEAAATEETEASE